LENENYNSFHPLLGGEQIVVQFTNHGHACVPERLLAAGRHFGVQARITIFK